MATLQTSRKWRGLNLFGSPDDIGPEWLTDATNVLIKGGRAVTRPGKRGQLTSPVNSPLYVGLPFIKADGTTQVLCDQGGRVYRWPKASTALTEISVPGAGALNSSGARWARLDKYAYRVAKGDPLIRTDLATGQSDWGLNAPTTPPTATVVGSTLAQLNLASSWSGDGSSPAVNLLPGYTGNVGAAQFPNATVGGGWSSSSDANLNGALLNLDAVGEEVHLDNGSGVTVKPNPAFTGNTALHAKRFRALGSVKTDSVGTNNNRVSVKVTAYSDLAGTTGAVTQTYAIPMPATTASTLVDHVFDFSGFAGEILSVSFHLINTAGTNGPAHFWVNQFQLLPIGVSVSFANGSPGVQVTITEAGSADGVLDVDGVALTADLGGPLGSDPGNILALDFDHADQYTGIAFHVDVQLAGSAAWTSIGPLSLTSNLSVGYVDISTLSAVDRAAIAKIRLTFTANVTNTDPTAALGIGPLIAGGNLSVDRGCYWVYAEVNPNGDVLLVNIIESSPSGYSNVVTPTADKATGSLFLPTAPLNAAATMFYLYRLGGIFEDGLARLVTKRKFSETFAYRLDPGQPGSVGDRPNPYIAYDHTTGGFTDNTPDSWLADIGTTIAQYGRDPAPSGAQAVCAWQNRLWLAVGGRLYASWEVATDGQAALYFNRVNLTDDPLNSVKGTQFAVGGADNDPIQALIPIGANSFFTKGFLVVIKMSGSVWLVDGDTPDNFSIRSYLVGQGLGCAAPRAAGLVENRVWWRGANCIYAFNADVVTPKSVPVETLLGANATPDEAFVYHGRRLLHLAHGPGQSANSRAYVWDSRQDGWTLWDGMNATSGVTLTSGADSDDLYLGGLDGQIYGVSGSGDKATPAASVVAVPFRVATRAMGREGGGAEFWQTSQATRLLFSVQAQEAATLAPGAGPALGGYQWTPAGGYRVAGAPGAPVQTDAALTCPCDVRGSSLEAFISGSVVNPLTVSALALETIETTLAMA